MTRVIVTGGRDFSDEDAVFAGLDNIHNQLESGITEVIQGEAQGVDRMAKRWATRRRISVKSCPITRDMWDTYGPYAGHIRNRYMLDTYKPDMVIAFAGGSGTRHMVGYAVEKGVPVIEVFSVDTSGVEPESGDDLSEGA